MMWVSCEFLFKHKNSPGIILYWATNHLSYIKGKRCKKNPPFIWTLKRSKTTRSAKRSGESINTVLVIINIISNCNLLPGCVVLPVPGPGWPPAAGPSPAGPHQPFTPTLSCSSSTEQPAGWLLPPTNASPATLTQVWELCSSSLMVRCATFHFNLYLLLFIFLHFKSSSPSVWNSK